MEQKLEELARKYRAKPIQIAYYVFENEEHRLYISYKDKTESSIKFKTREGAEAFIPRLYREPLPCKCCGQQPSKNNTLVSCPRCSIHVGTEAMWNSLMEETPPIRKLLNDTSEPVRVCKSVVALASEPLLVHMAMGALTKIGKLDLTDFFVDEADARREEQRLRKIS
jgi:hypothetical protein